MYSNMTFHKIKLIYLLFVYVFICMPVVAEASCSFGADKDSSDSIKIDRRKRGRSGNSADIIIPSIPASPQATAFQRVGDYKVNNASGTPDISIPLYELDHHGYKIPITLRYLPTPLKHGYNYDVTGHGWALNLGYCISRTIESWPDEKYDFKLNVTPINRDLSLRDERNNINEYIEQCDLGRDRFNVTLPNGESFSFFITNSNGNISIVAGAQGYDIQFVRSNDNHITSFTVYDNWGVQYLFDKTEKSINNTIQTNGREVAWYLSRITIPNVADPICFSYDKSITQNNGHGANEPTLIMKRLWGFTSDYNKLNFTYNSTDTWTHYQTRLLTKITFGTTKVDFNYVNENTSTTYNNLSSISIKDNQTELRNIKFDYNYQYPSGKLAILSKLTINGRQNTSDKLVYKFINHPANAIYGTDHWGYGNSVGGNSTYHMQQMANMNFYTEYYGISLSSLLTGTALPVSAISLNPSDYSFQQKAKLMKDVTGADPRQPGTPETHGILSTIIYPTGGKTVFVFENHRFITATDENGNYVETKKKRRIIKAGGFRIKSITNYTSDGVVSDVRVFRYGPTNQDVQNKHLNLPTIAGADMNEHIGYGEPVVDPTILTYTQIKSSSDIISKISRMLIGKCNPNEFSGLGNFNGKSGYQCTFSPLNFRSLLQGREPVVYSEITEYYGQMGETITPQNTTGKTVYEFQIYDDTGSTPDSVYNIPLRYEGNTLLVEGSAYKKDYLTKKTDYLFYNYGGKYYPTALQTETYKYSLYHRTTSNYMLSNNFDTSWYQYYLNNGSGNETFRIGYILNPISIGSYQMTEKKVTRDGITTTENTAYNSYGLISSQSFTGAKPHTTTYTYPVSGHSAAETILCQKHMHSSVISSLTKVQGNSSWNVSGYTIDYTTADYPQPLKLNRQLVVNGTSNGFEEEVQIKSYSANGNPTEIEDRSGMHTVYVWGYDDRYMIAEVKNATLATVNAALNASSGNVSGLRTNSSLANSIVTTWTYMPLVGVTSQTDASGITTYYDYDGLGRLKEVYRYEGNVVSSANKRLLNQYTYHTITQ